MQYLSSKTKSLSKLSHIETVKQARQQMIGRIQLETVPDYHRKKLDELEKPTKPMISDMITRRPNLRNRFTATTTWQLTIMIGIVSFMISSLLQCAGGRLWNQYGRRHTLTQLFIGRKDIEFKPLIVVSDGDRQLLRFQPEMNLMRYKYLLRESELRQVISPRSPAMPK